MSLAGKTLFITGASRGIGLAIGLRAARDGANVVVVAKTVEPHPKLPGTIHTAAAEIEAAGGKALAVQCDVRDDAQIAEAVQAAVDRFGGIDVVVNNAANALAQPLGEITADAFAKSNEVNVRGPLFLVQKALPHLKQSSHAAVLNVVSVGAFKFAADMSLYAAGKAAMMSYTRSMAAAFVGDGIRVNAIAPGPVDTDMMRNNPQEAIDGMVGGTLMKRLAHPDELVGAALLLCSDAGSFMTGTVVIVDGGGTPI
ncbi:MAG: SDR family oxidoreductase [Actinomycetota bacterium]|nr:SDR family oxidoreductase [Actinomycetota bacterium]